MSAPTGAGNAIAQLLSARRKGQALAGFPQPIPATLADAYAIQRQLCTDLAQPVVGWKVGRIPVPMIAALGAERLAGPVLRCAELGETAGDARVFEHGAAAIEVEVMLRLDRIPDAVPPSDQAGDYVSEIRAGFEVASSPAPDVHDHAPFGIIADIGINNGILLGPALDRATFDRLVVETSIEGAAVGSGRACDVLDGPWGSLRFLVDLHLRGVISLAPGQWISAGAITGVHPIKIGETATATFSTDVTISCVATPENGMSQ